MIVGVRFGSEGWGFESLRARQSAICCDEKHLPAASRKMQCFLHPLAVRKLEFGQKRRTQGAALDVKFINQRHFALIRYYDIDSMYIHYRWR